MLTILTPTYNRVEYLPQLYKSLKRQSCLMFEWVVVDDGSTDQTEQLINNLIKQSSQFPIEYVKQDNGGKHRALNKGIPLANYDYIYILDSDDYLVPNAVEKICTWIKQLEQDEQSLSFAGVSGLKGYKNGKRIGKYPVLHNANYIDATNLQRFKYKLQGDKAEVYKKDILLKFPFPEFNREKFLSECAVWDKIALSGYKVRWYNEIICICEYLEGGLTKDSSKELNNFEGYTYVTKQTVHSAGLLRKINAIARYLQVAKQKHLDFQTIQALLQVGRFDILLGLVGSIARKLMYR